MTFNWRQQDTPDALGPFFDVVRFNNLWIAVGAADENNGKIFTSPDGIAWTKRVSTQTGGAASGVVGTPAENRDYNGIAVSDSLAVIVGQWSGGDTNPAIQTSTNGIDWTGRPAAAALAASGSLFDVAEHNGLFVAVGFDSDGPLIVTSSDGITWTKRTVPGGAASSTALFRITRGVGLFVVAGFDSVSGLATVWTSPDGITWTTRAFSGTVDTTPLGIAFGDGTFVVVGGGAADPAFVQTSTNGTTWSARTASSASGYNGVAYDPIAEKFYACADWSGAQSNIWVSSDGGVTWAQDTTTPVANDKMWTFGFDYPISLVLGGKDFNTQPGVIFLHEPGFGSMRVRTGWLKPADYLGEFNCRKVGILGKRIGAGSLVVNVYHDYQETVRQQVIFDLDNWNGELDALVFTLERQRMSAISFEIADQSEFEEAGGFELTGLTLEIGVPRDKLVRPSVSKRS